MAPTPARAARGTRVTASLPTLADVLPFEDFSALVASLDEPGNEPFAQALDDLAKPALRRLVEARREAGLLRPVPNSEGHQTPLMTAWDGMVAGDRPDWYPDIWWDRVLDVVIDGIVVRSAVGAQMASGRPGADRDAALREEYRRLAARLDAGTLRITTSKRSHAP